MGEIRQPVKKNSIAKKNKIIKDGFKLMCAKGYHNVSSVDIAAAAGVSTGIIYQYFKDKRNIFIQGAQLYALEIMFPMVKVLDHENNKNNLEDMIVQIVNQSILDYKKNKKAHQELLSMNGLDEEVAKILKDNEILLTNKMVDSLAKKGLATEHLSEKVHLIINMIDSLAQEIVYHKHPNFDYQIMINDVIDLIMYLLNKKH